MPGKFYYFFSKISFLKLFFLIFVSQTLSMYSDKTVRKYCAYYYGGTQSGKSRFSLISFYSYSQNQESQKKVENKKSVLTKKRIKIQFTFYDFFGLIHVCCLTNFIFFRRFFKLHSTKCEPISFTVPRKVNLTDHQKSAKDNHIMVTTFWRMDFFTFDDFYLKWIGKFGSILEVISSLGPNWVNRRFNSHARNLIF